mgnify:CR=1 FL=1
MIFGAARTKKGVINVVKTETATMTGYKKSLVTPNVKPNDAIINENSPICVCVVAA